MELPYGDQGPFTNQTITGATAFNPDLSGEDLDKAVSPVDHMFLGEDRTIQKTGSYDATHDLSSKTGTKTPSARTSRPYGVGTGADVPEPRTRLARAHDHWWKGAHPRGRTWAETHQ